MPPAAPRPSAAPPCPAVERPRPARDEIAALAPPALVARYRTGVENFDPRMFELSDEQLDMPFLPSLNVGRWPVRVLLGHVADAELAYTHRLRRAFAEQDPVLSVWDENAFIDAGIYGTAGAGGGAHPIGGFLAVVHTLRRWTSEWLLTLAPEHWERRALHPERGAESIRTMLALATWHLEHHAWFLNAKVERFLGPAPAADDAPGGCGPSCGCRHGH